MTGGGAAGGSRTGGVRGGLPVRVFGDSPERPARVDTIGPEAVRGERPAAGVTECARVRAVHPERPATVIPTGPEAACERPAPVLDPAGPAA